MDDFKYLAYLSYRLIEGDDSLDEIYEILKRYNLVDDNHEWVYDEEDW